MLLALNFTINDPNSHFSSFAPIRFDEDYFWKENKQPGKTENLTHRLLASAACLRIMSRPLDTFIHKGAITFSVFEWFDAMSLDMRCKGFQLNNGIVRAEFRNVGNVSRHVEDYL